MQEAARRAIEGAGGIRATARAFGIQPSAVMKWTRRRVPADRVLDLERLCKAQVTRYEMRPDVYGS